MRCMIGLWGGLLLMGWSLPALAQTHAMPGHGPVLPAAEASVQPQPTKRGEKRVHLVAHDSTIAFVIGELARQANKRVSFDQSNPAFAKRISVRVDTANIMDALSEVLRGTGLVAKLVARGTMIIIQPANATADADSLTGTVTGRIVDSVTRKGVLGATITVPEAKVSTLSGEDGAFVLRNVPVGRRVLTVKLIGYTPVTRDVAVSANTGATLHVTLAPRASILSGVVTTATGVQQKLSVGSDITTINVDSVMQTAPITSVTDLLESRVPGLTVVHTDGVPGDPSRIRLRGSASLNGSNTPIVVVDGVRVYNPDSLSSNATHASTKYTVELQPSPRPSPLDQLDPNMIETIEVLKGPSASALYGSDAANGVIVITTKRGQPGRTRWSLTGRSGVNYIPGHYPTFIYGYGVSSTGTYGFCNGGIGQSSRTCLQDSTHAYQMLNDPRFSPLRHGTQASASATVSGGAEALTYAFTGSASNTSGLIRMPPYSRDLFTQLNGTAPPGWMMHPDAYITYSGSGQVGATLSPTAHVAVRASLSNSQQNRSSADMNAVYQMLTNDLDTVTASGDNTLLANYGVRRQQATLTSVTSASLNWQPWRWLPMQATAGFQRLDENDTRVVPAGVDIGATSDSGYYEKATNIVNVGTVNASTTIPVSLGRGVGLRLALGTNFVKQSGTYLDVRTTQLPEGVSVPSSFLSSATAVFQGTQAQATFGWFFEPQLNVGSRFFVMPGLRFDGGSTAGNNAGLSAFPKISMSYIALDRSGASSRGPAWSSALTLLRLRGAFGIAGVQPAPGQSLRLYAPAPVSLDGGIAASTANGVATLGNTQLHPERSREIETGFDAEFWDQRISFSGTYYYKMRYEAIVSAPVAASVGFTTGSFNLGNVRNTGLEWTASARVIESAPVTWDINGSVSTNHNTITRLAGMFLGTCRYAVGVSYDTNCYKVGYSLGAVFVRPVAGWQDSNENGIFENGELTFGDSAVYLGSGDPNYLTSFGTTIGLARGRVTLNLAGNYQNNMLQYNYMGQQALLSATNAPDATMQQKAQAAAFVYGSSIELWQSVSAFRLDAMSLNWTLPNAAARALRSRQVTVSLQGSNLLLVTNYRGKDPNVNLNLSGAFVEDRGQLPNPRTWSVAVRISQ